MPTLKILHVIPNLLKGGAQRLVIDTCNELRIRSNIQVKLIVFEDKNEFKHISQNIDIKFCHAKLIPSIFKKKQIDISNYENIIDAFQPDIIHSHLYLAELISRENIRKNITYFTHCHDNIIQYNKFGFKTLFSKIKITDFYERSQLFPKYLKSDNNFIAISKNGESFLKKILPKSLTKNISLLHNGVNIKAFHNPATKETENVIKLINVGNLVERKNQIFLIYMINYIKQKNINVYLKLIGDGANKKLLENEIERLNLKDCVQLLGAVDNIQPHLWESDIYVHSALYEPFGLVLIEAMAAGLPVICLDGKGNLDIIVQNQNGFVITEQKPETFAEKVLEIASDKKKLKNMSEYAKIFSEQYAIDVYINKLLFLYKNKIS